MGRRNKSSPGMPLLSDCKEFARMVEHYFSFLEAYGLQRAPEYDFVSPTGCGVAYKAETFWIDIYLDIRDNYVGVSVVTEDGKRERLSAFLKKRFGYEEKPSVRHLPSIIETSLVFYADQLRIYADKLFAK